MSRWKDVSKLTASGSATLGVLILIMRWVLLVVVVGGATTLCRRMRFVRTGASLRSKVVREYE